MIAGDIASFLAEDVAGLVAESVPNRWLASIHPFSASSSRKPRSRRPIGQPVGEAFRHDVPLVSRQVNWRLGGWNPLLSPLTTHQPLSATQAPREVFRSVSRNGPCSELGLVDDRRRNFAEPGIRIPARRRGRDLDWRCDAGRRACAPHRCRAAVISGRLLLRKHRTRPRAGNLLGDQA